MRFFHFHARTFFCQHKVTSGLFPVLSDVEIFILDFTVDSVNWASMKNLSDMLHENDQRFVLILDPAIPSEAGPDYKPVRDH